MFRSFLQLVGILIISANTISLVCIRGLALVVLGSTRTIEDLDFQTLVDTDLDWDAPGIVSCNTNVVKRRVLLSPPNIVFEHTEEHLSLGVTADQENIYLDDDYLWDGALVPTVGLTQNHIELLLQTAKVAGYEVLDYRGKEEAVSNMDPDSLDKEKRYVMVTDHRPVFSLEHTEDRYVPIKAALYFSDGDGKVLQLGSAHRAIVLPISRRAVFY